ncbi:MAG: hypothetical protein RLY20_536 [Verrucomicrobiota bacterium]
MKKLFILAALVAVVSAMADPAAKSLKAPPAAAPLFECDFSKLPTGALPESFMVMQGEFTVKDLGTNKVIELPGAPVDSFSVLFGPVTNANISIEANILSTSKGRRMPVFGVGSGGVGGYKLQIAPAKKSAELILGDSEPQVIASAPFVWESGSWTHCKLQIRRSSDAWRVEAKAWKSGEAEPKDWLLATEAKEAPISGQPSVLGSPLAGTPILFDDLKVTSVP